MNLGFTWDYKMLAWYETCSLRQEGRDYLMLFLSFCPETLTHFSQLASFII